VHCPLCGTQVVLPAELRIRPEGWLTVEESAELLHAIFPNYPNTEVHNPIPDPRQFIKGGAR
jgi:hypothetical protein